MRAVLPAMQAAKSGNIINISSVAAFGGSHYGATKRAIEAMTIGLARELKDDGITVNAMRPVGGIETPGLMFGRPASRPAGAPGPAPGTARPGLPKPDSYVEAAILLALQTPDSFTGQVFNDAQLIEKLSDEATKTKYRESNPENWVKAMTV